MMLPQFKKAFVGMVFLNTISVMSQNMSFGADNFYRSDNVTKWPVTFPTQYDTTVAGNLFLPDNLDRSVNYSAIIVGHPAGAVKEQAADLYATKMAEASSPFQSIIRSLAVALARRAIRSRQIFWPKHSRPLLITSEHTHLSTASVSVPSVSAAAAPT
jgi:hypothetical protein